MRTTWLFINGKMPIMLFKATIVIIIWVLYWKYPPVLFLVNEENKAMKDQILR